MGYKFSLAHYLMRRLYDRFLFVVDVCVVFASVAACSQVQFGPTGATLVSCTARVCYSGRWEIGGSHFSSVSDFIFRLPQDVRHAFQWASGNRNITPTTDFGFAYRPERSLITYGIDFDIRKPKKKKNNMKPINSFKAKLFFRTDFLGSDMNEYGHVKTWPESIWSRQCIVHALRMWRTSTEINALKIANTFSLGPSRMTTRISTCGEICAWLVCDWGRKCRQCRKRVYPHPIAKTFLNWVGLAIRVRANSFGSEWFLIQFCFALPVSPQFHHMT